MHIVNIYLPQVDHLGVAFDEAVYASIRAELIHKFGGLTQYDQVPAIGYWKAQVDHPVSKDLVIHYEVICDRLIKSYWADLRKRLEATFKQTQILIVAHPIVAL